MRSLKRNPGEGLIVLWVKLMQRGYTRSITALYRTLRKNGQMRVKPTNPKYIPKPYEQMIRPGQRVQIDVKHVPAVCLLGEAAGEKFYQYTAIDEFPRLRYVEAFNELSTYSSARFIDNMLKSFPFPVECVQTDNGAEFTNRFTSLRDKPSLFELTLRKYGVTHKLIRPYTPRHNGKVERSHRKDNEYFYALRSFFSFEDFQKTIGCS